MGKKELTEQNLGDIILCEPITDRGREALEGIELKNIVTEEYFFNKLYIRPKYYEEQPAGVTDEKSIGLNEEEECLHYNNYSVTRQKFKDRKAKLEIFDEKFIDDAPNHSPLNVIGTTGVGKSIEAYAKIRNPKRNNITIESNRIVYNLEKSFTTIRHGAVFSLDDKQKKDGIWLICISLLGKLYNLATEDNISVYRAASNHKKYFEAKANTDDTEDIIFSCIKKYRPRNAKKTGKKLFEAMIKLIDDKNPGKSIRDILTVTMNLMYCINPKNKNYIVFDNLEHHINLNEQDIVIHNKVLSVLYETLEEVTNDIIQAYHDIKTDESWKAFKLIAVMRRTSGNLIVKNTEHYGSKILAKGNDYTGHFDIWRIWEKKKQYIWDEYLKEKYDEKQSSEILYIIDDMMNDNPSNVTAVGKIYQDLISPLMNSGIRRNGRAQAHAAMSVYDIISNLKSCYINYETYKTLLKNEKEKKPIRYMYRRALLEIQYKWMILPDEVSSRFENLFLGKLSAEEKDTDKIDKNKTIIKTRDVLWDNMDKNNTTLVRRILSYLSNFIDDKTYKDDSRGLIFGTDMFETKSLYDLMSCIFLNPSEDRTKKLCHDEHFLPLAKVLISLGKMSPIKTKTAPFVILDINDPAIDSNDSEDQTAVILKRIWDAGPESSINGDYKCVDFGVRLTEAGYVFLCDIQPSFSFFAALYCSEEVPLFFLTDPERIKFVIDTIYKEANDLCKAYEDAASSFCGPENTLLTGNYLPKHNNKNITFRHRVKEYHSRHLELYIDYIEKNAADLGLIDDRSNLKKFINNIISEYGRWETGKEIADCF